MLITILVGEGGRHTHLSIGAHTNARCAVCAVMLFDLSAVDHVEGEGIHAIDEATAGRQLAPTRRPSSF